jgi:uncharacterized membrane protein
MDRLEHRAHDRFAGRDRRADRRDSRRLTMALAVTSYELSLFIHITAAIAGLGATFAEGLTYPVARRMDPRYLPYKHSLQLAINKYMALPALLVLIATGLYQADEAGFELGRTWLVGAMSIVALLAVMIVAYFVPEDRRLLAIVQRDLGASKGGEVALSDEYLGRVRMEEILGGVAGLLVIAAVYLMVTKPGL